MPEDHPTAQPSYDLSVTCPTCQAQGPSWTGSRYPITGYDWQCGTPGCGYECSIVDGAVIPKVA